ncbi:hypothetical protein BDZ31_001170 [Conexibacter arvalis]|uniref:Uncharacterized protein n=1 Tax=Conexibacter arvalis TaxID=912552 RepID=A0A840I9K2_9ACTN|nr:hypothetical protein [Conexibacter arvalis]
MEQLMLTPRPRRAPAATRDALCPTWRRRLAMHLA